MSVIYAGICEEGIVMAADTRLMMEGTVVNDTTSKVFAARNMVVSIAGMGTVVTDSGFMQISDLIRQKLDDAPQITPSDFLRWVKELTAETLRLMPCTYLNKFLFYIGAKDARGYYLIQYQVDKMEEYYSKSYQNSRILAAGALDYAALDHDSDHQERTVQKLEQLL